MEKAIPIVLLRRSHDLEIDSYGLLALIAVLQL